MNSHRLDGDHLKSHQEMIADEIQRIQKEPNSLLRRKSRRWIIKEASKSKHKALLRSQRLLLHKQVTSQTEESRKRFSDQLIEIKAKLGSLLQPPPHGHLLPSKLTIDSITNSKGVRRGKSVWCSLNQKIVSQIAKREPHRVLKNTKPSSLILHDLIQAGLEERVLEEIKILRRRLIRVQNSKALESGWIIRRLRGPEVRSVLQSGQIHLHYGGEESPLACIIASGGEIKTNDESLEVYHLDKIFQDEQRGKEFKEAMRAIAILLREKARKGRKKLKEQILPANQEGQLAKENPSRESTSALPHSGQKYPRLHAIKRNESTVDLCVALWRLHVWSSSAG